MSGKRNILQWKAEVRAKRVHRYGWLLGAALVTVLGGLPGAPAASGTDDSGQPLGQPPRGVVSPGTPVGTLGGTVSVGVAGGASWTAALKAVPGPGDMQPALAIGYGGGGYGGIGVGFSLSGLSTISRCAHTHGQDGYADAIDWSNDDRLCMDGERLIAVSGSYGAGGTEYRPRSAGTVRIVARGASTDPLSGFTVYTPDGRISEYGVPSAGNWHLASVVANLPGGKAVPLVWAIHHVQDRFGNRMDFEYAGEVTAEPGRLSPQDQRIQTIDYGINSSAGTSATRRLTFTYATLGGLLGPEVLHDYDLEQNLVSAGVLRGYVAGAGYERTRLLTDVTQSVRTDDAQDWTTVRAYELQYDAVAPLKADAPPDQVRLAAMRECDGLGNCLPDTHFEWSDSPTAQTLEAWSGFAFDGTPFYPLPPPSEQDKPYRRAGLQVVGDFDADGVSDMLVSPEWVNSNKGADERWELWQIKADAAEPLQTTIPAWSATEWVDRTGGVVVPGSLVQEAQAARTGRQRDGKASMSAWAVNVDGTYGTDVLIGRPQADLAGAGMDPPWGYGSQTWRSRTMPLGAPAYCTGFYAQQMPGYTAEEVDKINWGYYDECEEYLDKSPADMTGHPGIMASFELWRLKPGTQASFEKQDLKFPAGRPALWAQPADLNGDRLTDLVFCKADANYAAVSGKPMPMYYRDADQKTNWVSGTVHYALNAGGILNLAKGGIPVVTGGATQRCHLKDSLYVLDLYGDGRESVMHRAHPTAGAQTIAAIDWPVPEETLVDPYPYDDNDAALTTYTQKLHEKMYAEWETGAAFYRALTWSGATVQAVNTGLPYDEFMRWHGRGGNASARYSRYMPSQPGDVDATSGWSENETNRRVAWGSPAAPETGYGPGEARFADVNRDGLTDVVYVDLADCRYATDQTTFPDEWPVYPARTCSFQDVMEFGGSLWEQTYEKLTVDVYANRGDGTFELLQSKRWWDTDLTHPQYTGKQLGDALLKGAQWNNAEEYAIYKAAWTIATTATRLWRTEFASSQFGDGNGDGAPDLAYLGMQFYPNGGWVGETMAGTYVVRPQWRVGRIDGGGFRETTAPLIGGALFDELLPTNKDGLPPWANDGTLWVSNGKPMEISAYEQQEYGLPVRWQLGDFDRDGVQDAMLYDHVEGRWRFIHGKATNIHAPVPQLLTAVVNGLGERTEIRYAPQHTLPATGTQWSLADLTLPYPLVSRPSNALVVDTLRRDSGLDAQGQGTPIFNSTHYSYGKSVADVLRGVALGLDTRETWQTVKTDSGVVKTRRIERYDTTAAYDGAKKAYPLAGTLIGEISEVSGEEDEPTHLTHTGYRYAGKAGVKPGTWRRELNSTAATTYEIPSGKQDLAQKLTACLSTAYDAATDCALGAEEAYQPLTHVTQWHGYDGYGYLTTELTESAGTSLLNERTLLHQDTLNAYVLGLPKTAWTAHEPSSGAGFTLRTTVYGYYPNGALKETTVEPDRVDYRHSVELKYDLFGNVKERWVKSDVGGWMPTYSTYSPSGAYAVEIKNAKGHTTKRQWTDPYYEACGVAERAVSIAGHAQVMDIDTFCRTTGEASYYGAQPLAPKVSTSYAEWDPDGNEEYKDVDLLVTTSVADGAKTYAIADRVGRNVVAQQPGFGFEVYTRTRYDALGRTVAESLPTKVGEQPLGWTSTRYDALGRVREATAPDGTLTTTAMDRYETSVTDALGHVSTSRMNALGQIVRVDPPADPEGTATAMCYAYGAFGAMTRVEPCRHAANKQPVVFKHDDYGRVTQVTSAALGTRTTQYDQLGRVWRTTDAKGQTTRFVYDDLNRPTHRIEADGTPGAKTATWVYDTKVPGALTEARNGDGTVIEYPYYDGYRRPAGLDVTIHGVAFGSRLDYDSRGRVETSTLPSVDPQSAVEVATQYNSKDQVIGRSWQGTSLWEPLETNAFGQTTRQQYGNGLEATAEYDPLNGRLATASVLKTVTINNQPPTPVVIEQFDYDWYDNGLLERRTQKGLVPNVLDQSDLFYYNPRGELTAWTTLGAAGQAQARLARYDGYGNITKGPHGDYGYVGEQLMTVVGDAGTVSYQYDANGNIKVRDHNGTKTVLDYDALNQVEGIQEGATQSTYEITYSADGVKVYVKETDSGRETFYLDGYQREQGGKLGAQIVERINLGPAHLTRAWTGDAHADTLAYLTPTDPLGSLTLITDAQGLIHERRSYGVWGEERDPADWIQTKATPEDTTHGVAAGYTGHERKRFGSLLDMKARYYDPLTQRMVQADTVVPSTFNPLGWNSYAYVNNNPVAYTDPTGHAPTGGGGGREFTPEQNMRALMDFMAGAESFGNQYAAANGMAPMGGDSGAMLGQGGIHALRAIHMVRTAAKLGDAMVADHQQQMDAAPRATNQDMKTVMLFDRDWWGFVRAGKLPPFRTVDQYKQWLSASPEARASMMSSVGMYGISQGHVSFVWGQMGANAGALGSGGLRNARTLANPDDGNGRPAPEAPGDGALDAAGAAGGPGGPKGPGWRWPWSKKPDPVPVVPPGLHVTLPAGSSGMGGLVWLDGKTIGTVSVRNGVASVYIDINPAKIQNLPQFMNDLSSKVHDAAKLEGSVKGFQVGLIFESYNAASTFRGAIPQLHNPYGGLRGYPIQHVAHEFLPEAGERAVTYGIVLGYNVRPYGF